MHSNRCEKPGSRGFALIVTLSLMILLTVIAVGLLSISSISLRSASQDEAMQAARANARVALMLAIGDLQKQLGPDTRISATADQLTGSDPAVSTTPQTQRQWTGAYKSWAAASPNVSTRPTPEFLQWFVSGSNTNQTNKSFPTTAVGTKSTESVEIVSKNTVGTGDTVRVPLLSQELPNKSKNTYAWWVSDLGTKALVAPAKDVPTAVAEVRADQQASPASDLKAAGTGTVKPFATLASNDKRLANVVSWQSSGLLADKPENIRGLFHDFTTQSRGLLTNVRTGGFRKDLSMALERTAANAPNPVTTALYTVGGEPGINLQELWAYYSLSASNSATGLQRSGGAAFTTGGTIASSTPFLSVASGPAACKDDTYFFYKQPVIISCQLAFSFQTRPVNDSTSGNKPVTRLYLSVDPIVTFWNPLDVPVVVPTSSYFSVKYWNLPYDIKIGVNGTFKAERYPLISTLSPISTSVQGDGNFLSLQIGQAQQLVFKPGEVIKVSQSGTMLVKGTDPVDHALVAKSGFNFGGGYTMPVRDTAGKYVDVNSADLITYQAIPNHLTAGTSPSDPTDGSMLPGTRQHSRHYSLLHNEYYIGDDRGSNSLGIGNLAMDWDFGNSRLKPGATRTKDQAGTKPKADRLYADDPRFAEVFKSLLTSREIPVSNLGTKQAILLFSFNAKTESNSTSGTRVLSRFNPKALHVDNYYIVSKDSKMPRDSDLLPYEYNVELLNSWKSNNLEVSTNGNAYFGGGMTAQDGASFITTHSIPKEPIVSLAAFQYSFANGFTMQKPPVGDWSLCAREPLLPQISHAIGNSQACSVLAMDKVEGSLAGGRPLADHSYLANQALWDDYFLSGIAPQIFGFNKQRAQKTVASDFLAGTGKLPVVRYTPDLRGQDSAKILTTYFPGTTPSATATDIIASLIRVDGMFNVNSTSVEAWKSLLGGRKGRPVVIRDANGRESVKAGGSETPVAGLLGPLDVIAKGDSNVDGQEPNQWVGRRTLSDTEVEALARAIVKQVRKRGPFTSLADFVNRRVGTDAELARSGAIQSALDSADTTINAAYLSGTRAVSDLVSKRFAFNEAEQGPMSYGSPGIVKQADILTPIAPILSARSDSFLIRGYGEKTDATGKVIARAWCEAVVQRSPQFIDPADAPEKAYTSINTLNKTFGRRFEIISFRWLNGTEA